ncbi:Uridine phosphorylase [Pseudonocardia thermophila]|jgi:Uridine phosphorylase|uniref:Uridine phosphorylase n=1 Tax=Pseudonocardia thermophila TaxID=1848 RepID=A0A1M6SJ76_PSETH|nr:nucleoside phosphorylase [Pseudonocardia thermophila]SHK44659.1 Uridine phosphorylase [Pseudonocardia thermophila]
MDLPLLEDDLAEPGVIEPDAIVRRMRVDAMPDTAVLCFFPEVIKRLAADGARLICSFKLESGRTPVHEIEVGGRRIAVLQPGVGAPLAAVFMEDLIALGVRRFVAVGGAGALLPELVLGHAVVVESAVRDEGTSFHYLPAGAVVDADPAGVAALCTTLDAAGVPYLRARTWTTDAVYRETRSRVERRRAMGCAVVEMEAAALIAVARYRGVSFAQLLLSADSLAGEEWEHRGWTTAAAARQGMFEVAAQAAAALA